MPWIQTAIPGPRSLELAAELQKVESPDTTFFSKEFPIFWDRAVGGTVTDVDGNRYLDLNAGFGAAAVGHAHLQVVHAIRKQSARMIHGMGDVHPTEIRLRLAEQLVARMPKGSSWKVIFGNSGSEAIEAAMKTAALATGKPGLIVFRGGYHGLSIGALAATQWPKFHEGFEALIAERAVVLPYPGNRKSEPIVASAKAVLAAARKALEGKTKSPAPIGGILVEPILGRGGVVVPPRGFLKGLRELCDEFGVLLIADEIFTGIGRTGAWLACDHEGIVPDLVCAGKALGGGMPISACIGKSEIIDRWGASKGEARHTSTFLGHPLACAAALAVLRVMDEEQLISAAQAKGNRLLTLLLNELGDVPVVAAVRGRGLMVGLEMVNARSGKPNAALAWSVIIESLKRGVIALVAGMEGNIVSLTPPLTIGEHQMEHAVGVLAESIKAARSQKKSK